MYESFDKPRHGVMSVCLCLHQVFVKQGDVESKMLSALLTGVNRAYPFAKGSSTLAVLLIGRVRVFAFSALTLLVGHKEEHLACKYCEMGCWCGYLCGSRCRLFAT